MGPNFAEAKAASRRTFCWTTTMICRATCWSPRPAAATSRWLVLSPLNPGFIVVMDRGYNDYALFGKWTTEEIYFVTRLQENAAFEVVQQCAVPQHRNILSDQLIRFSGDKALKDCPCLLRRVVVWDDVKEREIALLTNLLAFGATTIAAIYRDRWAIELFFKALKQNRKLKSFVGTSENALPAKPLDLMITLPFASPEGDYQVEVLNSAGKPADVHASGRAFLKNGNTFLQLRLDLRSLRPDFYQIGIRRIPYDWVPIPVQVR
jgi:hypothetical protein